MVKKLGNRESGKIGTFTWLTLTLHTPKNGKTILPVIINVSLTVEFVFSLVSQKFEILHEIFL